MILDRYLLRQIAGPVLIALLALLVLFAMVQLVKVGEVSFAAGLTGSDLLLLVGGSLPGFAVLAVPLAVLTGILLAFGRLAADGELMALAAAGLPAHRLLPVPLALGAAAAVLAFVLGAWIAPASAEGLHAASVRLAKRQVVAALEPGRFFEEIPRVLFYPQRAGDGPNRFEGFLLYDHRPGRTRHALLARRAVIAPRAGSDRLELQLTDGEVHARDKRRDRYGVLRFERATIGVDIERLIRDRTRFLRAVERLDLGALRAAAAAPDREPRERLRLRAALQRRFAFPGACVVFALLGTALGASGRLRGRRRTLLAAAVVVVAYYLLVRVGDALVDGGRLAPGLAAWLPNALIGLPVIGWLVCRSRVP